MKQTNLTDADASDIGRAFMQKLPGHFSWNECPTEYLTQLHDQLDYNSKEYAKLRKRNMNQRRELRLLNKQADAIRRYWSGYENGLRAAETMTLRGKMIKAFGHEAVHKAEREK